MNYQVMPSIIILCINDYILIVIMIIFFAKMVDWNKAHYIRENAAAQAL